MERVFWVQCPKCGDKFVCDYELRHTQYKLYCPYCHHTFLDKESPWIDDRRG